MNAASASPAPMEMRTSALPEVNNVAIRNPTATKARIIAKTNSAFIICEFYVIIFFNLITTELR